ncbi:MAG: hypothetical protein HY908_02060 [Myxococcales bacterium]|nr:hypothetical protein [Myxococcales bacterium]
MKTTDTKSTTTATRQRPTVDPLERDKRRTARNLRRLPRATLAGAVEQQAQALAHAVISPEPLRAEQVTLAVTDGNGRASVGDLLVRMHSGSPREPLATAALAALSEELLILALAVESTDVARHIGRLARRAAAAAELDQRMRGATAPAAGEP